MFHCGGQLPDRPPAATHAAISVRELAPSLETIFETWTDVILVEMNNSSAMPPLVRPSVTSCATSRSRGVSHRGSTSSTRTVPSSTARRSASRPRTALGRRRPQPPHNHSGPTVRIAISIRTRRPTLHSSDRVHRGTSDGRSVLGHHAEAGLYVSGRACAALCS